MSSRAGPARPLRLRQRTRWRPPWLTSAPHAGLWRSAGRSLYTSVCGARGHARAHDLEHSRAECGPRGAPGKEEETRTCVRIATEARCAEVLPPYSLVRAVWKSRYSRRQNYVYISFFPPLPWNNVGLAVVPPWCGRHADYFSRASLSTLFRGAGGTGRQKKCNLIVLDLSFTVPVLPRQNNGPHG